MDKLRLARVHLEAQEAHKGFERVLIDVAIETPDGFQDGLPAHDAARVAEQQFEKAELARSKVELIRTAGDAAGGGAKVREVNSSRLSYQ